MARHGLKFGHQSKSQKLIRALNVEPGNRVQRPAAAESDDTQVHVRKTGSGLRSAK
jgi:hypothetical protein